MQCNGVHAPTATESGRNGIETVAGAAHDHIFNNARYI